MRESERGNKRENLREFRWQEGYAIISVSESVVPRVHRGQEEHHRKKTYREDLVTFSARTVWITQRNTCGIGSAAHWGGDFLDDGIHGFRSTLHPWLKATRPFRG